jgi:hypothetical protein
MYAFFSVYSYIRMVPKFCAIYLYRGGGDYFLCKYVRVKEVICSHTAVVVLKKIEMAIEQKHISSGRQTIKITKTLLPKSRN